MATYFADTSFWIGLSSKRDQYHHRAVASDVSTRRIAAVSCLRVRADAHIEVAPLQAELMVSAVELYRGRADKNWSLTDCLSFVVMQRRGLTEALTTDHDVGQAGLKALMLAQPSI